MHPVDVLLGLYPVYRAGQSNIWTCNTRSGFGMPKHSIVDVHTQNVVILQNLVSISDARQCDSRIQEPSYYQDEFLGSKRFVALVFQGEILPISADFDLSGRKFCVHPRDLCRSGCCRCGSLSMMTYSDVSILSGNGYSMTT